MQSVGNFVLSRKGFDSVAGGSYSPFDPETGNYILLPIPVGGEELNICNKLKYQGIRIKSGHLSGYYETNLKNLMNSMGKEPKFRGEVRDYAHLDPWLARCPWLEESSNHEIGVFGQVGAAQAHLHGQHVDKGSIFLFFSRFKPIKSKENRVVPTINPENLKGGLYFIYGWLKIGEVIREYEKIEDPRLLSHPHATKEYFNRNNAIYVADKFLFPNHENLPGCGYFPRLSEDLLLTASEQTGNWVPSRWSLPGFFFENNNCQSVLKNRWHRCDNGSYIVNTSGRWQEAVFSQSTPFHQWLQGLIETLCD